MFDQVKRRFSRLVPFRSVPDDTESILKKEIEEAERSFIKMGENLALEQKRQLLRLIKDQENPENINRRNVMGILDTMEGIIGKERKAIIKCGRFRQKTKQSDQDLLRMLVIWSHISRMDKETLIDDVTLIDRYKSQDEDKLQNERRAEIRRLYKEIFEETLKEEGEAKQLFDDVNQDMLSSALEMESYGHLLTNLDKQIAMINQLKPSVKKGQIEWSLLQDENPLTTLEPLINEEQIMLASIGESSKRYHVLQKKVVMWVNRGNMRKIRATKVLKRAITYAAATGIGYLIYAEAGNVYRDLKQTAVQYSVKSFAQIEHIFTSISGMERKSRMRFLVGVFEKEKGLHEHIVEIPPAMWERWINELSREQKEAWATIPSATTEEKRRILGDIMNKAAVLYYRNFEQKHGETLNGQFRSGEERREAIHAMRETMEFYRRYFEAKLSIESGRREPGRLDQFTNDIDATLKDIINSSFAKLALPQRTLEKIKNYVDSRGLEIERRGEETLRTLLDQAQTSRGAQEKESREAYETYQKELQQREEYILKEFIPGLEAFVRDQIERDLVSTTNYATGIGEEKLKEILEFIKRNLECILLIQWAIFVTLRLSLALFAFWDGRKVRMGHRTGVLLGVK